MVHAALDRWLAAEAVGETDGRFALPTGGDAAGLPTRDAALLARLTAPAPVAQWVRSRIELAAVDRLVARGLVMLSGVTPSDASHVLGRLAAWDGAAAGKAVALMARRRNGRGERVAADAAALARAIVEQLTAQTAGCLLEAAFAEDPAFAGADPAALAAHPLAAAGLAGHRGVVEARLRLAVPVVGLGASAPAYYPAVGARLGCRMVLPEHAGVANAIGAVVGQIAQAASGTITSPAEGRYVAHLPTGPRAWGSLAEAEAALVEALAATAAARARAAGAAEVHLATRRAVSEVEIEGRPMFIEARLTVTASGRPRVARAAPAAPELPAGTSA
jgi:N-methylhydantoinase A/oxoprolinase/acetone carboxylase beta subunit